MDDEKAVEVPPDAIWRTIPGYPSYSVSNYGHVRRDVSSGGAPAGHMLKTKMNKYGYPTYNLRRGANVRKTIFAHRLVALAFIGDQPSPAHQIAHNDGDKKNCHVSNLRWATAKENAADRFAHGRTILGERTKWAKLSDEQVEAMRADKTSTNVYWAARYGVSDSLVSAIRLGQRRKFPTDYAILRGPEVKP